MDIPKTAQGPARPATAEEIGRETDPGYTAPDLHRRIDNENTPMTDYEIKPDTYILNVSGVNSYRTTTHTIHDEESTTTEIP